MTLEEIKNIAINHPDQLEINWDKIDSEPMYAEQFEFSLSLVTEKIPDLESLYTKLTSGKSVLFHNTDTPLKHDDIEKYTQLVAEELIAAYEMADLYDRYQKVKNVIKA